MVRKSKNSPRPTDGELAILRVLWSDGACTVRQVHARLGREIGYTTILKLMQIMTEKGLVERAELVPPARGHVYRASQPAQTTQRQLLRDLVEKAFGGSAAQLVLQALSTKRATAEELREIRAMLDSHSKDERRKTKDESVR